MFNAIPDSLFSYQEPNLKILKNGYSCLENEFTYQGGDIRVKDIYGSTL